MSDNIRNFRLGDIEGSEGYNRVILQIFGLPGNGKSSFINSCKFVMDGGVFVAHAEARNSHQILTKKRIPYNLTESIWMVDNRGMPSLDRFQTGEIFAQLGNLLPLNQEVKWVEDFNTNVDRVMAEFNNEDSLQDLIVPILIHSVRCNIQNEAETYRELLNTARELTGINPYIVLTHKYSGGVESVKSVFTNMGIEKIYTIENYTAEGQPVVREKHEEIIKFLTEVLEDIKFRVRHMGDPREERRKHLNFIIKYIKKNSDLKKEEENEKKNSEKELGGKKGPCTLL
ncbi:uncharacterized protein LOC143925338 [Lithobates pipiens]